jgi:phage gp36-like protein
MPDAIIDDAIAEASSLVDGYVGGPYASNDFVPGLIQYWTRDVAAYLATLTWRKSKDLTPEDPVVLRYNTVTTMLTDVMNGSLVISSPGNGLNGGTVIDGPPDIAATVVNPFPPTLSPFPMFVEVDYDLYGQGTRMNWAGGRWSYNWAGVPVKPDIPDNGVRVATMDPGPPGG